MYIQNPISSFCTDLKDWRIGGKIRILSMKDLALDYYKKNYATNITTNYIKIQNRNKIYFLALKANGEINEFVRISVNVLYYTTQATNSIWEILNNIQVHIKKLINITYISLQFKISS